MSKTIHRTSLLGGVLTCIAFILMLSPIQAQLFFSQPITSESEIKVLDETKNIYKYPWAGGMNSCQFGEIDLNLDGIQDLFVFDRMGDRILCFINGGSPNTVDYDYAPQFADYFPDLYDWVILKDYNNDGLPDIFTYSKDHTGILVYKNVSQNELEFELEIYPYLTSFQGGGYVNILATDVDYPAIEDIDYDGDMDILTFWALGSFVEYHQNQSMELYGVPDSLIFSEVTQCWGYFAENEESNVIYLDTCLGWKSRNEYTLNSVSDQIRDRHTGSTFLLLDLDADNDMDLLLGDVDYPNPIELINGGNKDSAYMISQDPQFPSYNKPVDLFSMPSLAYMDINNDNLNDLIASPFDPSPYSSENQQSVWLYSNSGENNQPDFNFETKDFIQNEMIDVGSGACPVFQDYDGDGLMDLFISNYGYYMYSHYLPGMFLESIYWSAITLYRNTGTAEEPQFSHITHNFEGLQSLNITGIVPTFADLDNDQDADLLFGRDDGTLVYMKNNAGPGEIMDFDDPILDYQSIDVGEYSAPQLYDLNNDGLIDLVIGEENGNLNYYINTGSLTVPEFTYVTDSLGKVDVRAPEITYTLTGYSIPYFFKNQDNETELLVGSEQGKVFYFMNIDENLMDEFPESDSLFLLVGNNSIDFPNVIRSAATITELDNDGYLEMLIGNFSGGLHFYESVLPPGVASVPVYKQDSGFEVYPNPVRDILYINARYKNESFDFDMVLTNLASQTLLVRRGTNSSIQELDMLGLDPGLYFLKVQTSDGSTILHHSKVVKIR